MEEIYTIENLAAMTGLSSRTIRNYIASGQLEGTKCDGAWQFTPEQFGRFLQQDMVRQSLQAKANGRVYDFLLAGRRQESAACLIWDRPVEGDGAEQALREDLMEKVNRSGLCLSYRYEDGSARAICTGSPKAIGELLEELA